jgi:hypothetical protein
MSIESAICEEIAHLRNNNINSIRLQTLENIIHTMNVDKRNKSLIEAFATNLLTICEQIANILQMNGEKIKHALIYGPTQIGKTNGIVNFIKKCVEQKIPVVISSDNKTDQHEQLFERLYKELSLLPCSLMKCEDITATDVKKSFNDNLVPIVFCLDNFAQIENVKMSFMETMIMKKFKQIAIIHDEGDVVTRGEATYENEKNKKRAKSHEKWVRTVPLNTNIF